MISFARTKSAGVPNIGLPVSQENLDTICISTTFFSSKAIKLLLPRFWNVNLTTFNTASQFFVSKSKRMSRWPGGNFGPNNFVGVAVISERTGKCINCVRQNAYYLRRFSVPRVLRCPAGIDRGCWVISGFRHRLGLTDTLGLDLMLVSIRCLTRWI